MARPVTPAKTASEESCSKVTRDAAKEGVLLRAPTRGAAPAIVTTANCTDKDASASRRPGEEVEEMTISERLTLSSPARAARSVEFSSAPNEDTPAREMEEETVVCVTLTKPDGLTVQVAEPGDGADVPAGQAWHD